jgi:hypothetical protein
VFIGIGCALLLGKKTSFQARVWGALVVAAAAGCTYCTGSRAGLICMMLVVILVCCWRTRWALLLWPVGGLVLFWAIPNLLNESWMGRFEVFFKSDDVRKHFPAMAWQLLQATPFGCGLGNTVELAFHGTSWSFEIVPSTSIWAGFNSFWLNLFSRLGVPGLITFILLIGKLFRYIQHRLKKIEDPWVKAFLVGGLIGFVGQWTIWIVNNTYMLPGGNLNFWFLMGMLVAGSRVYSKNTQPVPIVLTPDWQQQMMPAKV